MKKIIALMLVFTLAFTLFACGGKNETPDTDQSGPSAEEPFVKPENYAAVLVISINPQFQLYLDENNGVLAVEPINEDAKSFSDSIAFEGQSVEAVMGTIVEKANENGFINENATVDIAIGEQGELSLLKLSAIFCPTLT